MIIKSVKLVDSGNKGIIVEYATSDQNNGKSFVSEHKSIKKAPIHQELKDEFNNLKSYFLDICNYSIETKDVDMFETEIVGVSYSSKGISLIGTKDIMNGRKSLSIITPLLTISDGYNDFCKIENIIKIIFTETKAYMLNEKQFSETPFILDNNSYTNSDTLKNIGCQFLDPNTES